MPAASERRPASKRDSLQIDVARQQALALAQPVQFLGGHQEGAQHDLGPPKHHLHRLVIALPWRCEAAALTAVMRGTRGNRTEAVHQLEIDRKTPLKKLKDYDLEGVGLEDGGAGE